MKKISEIGIYLLLEGAKMEGSFVEGLNYNFENFYEYEWELIKKFAKWIDEEVGGASRYNIDQLFKAFINPTDESLQFFVVELKEKIESIRKLTA